MKNRLSIAAALIAASSLLATPGMAAAPAAPKKPAPVAGSALPAPKILVINRQAILANSKVGQDIARQVRAYTEQAEKEFKGQGDALRNQGQNLQRQLAILAPDKKAKMVADFQAKERNLQAQVDKRQSLIQGGVLQAREAVEKALAPIIQGIMAERGANLLIDRAAVVYGTADMEITTVAIDRLNQKMPAVKVNLAPPPPGTEQPGQ